VIPRDRVRELVDAHAKLDDPMTAAIWIRRDAPQAWLVEVIPSLGPDERAADPTFFNPGVQFRFPLALIAANKASLEAALRRTPELARDVAAGEVLFDAGGDADEIIRVAREILAA
jgi:hypothetical protein